MITRNRAYRPQKALLIQPNLDTSVNHNPIYIRLFKGGTDGRSLFLYQIQPNFRPAVSENVIKNRPFKGGIASRGTRLAIFDNM